MNQFQIPVMMQVWPGWPHTNCQCRRHNTGWNLFSFNFLYFQLATSFHSDRGNTISPVAEVAPHGRGRSGGGPISASLEVPAWRW